MAGNMEYLDMLEYDSIPYKEVDGKSELSDDVLKINKETLDILVQLNDILEEKKFLDIYHDRIRARNWVGEITVNDLTIRILPKIISISESKNLIERQEKIKNTSGKIVNALVKMLEIAWDVPIRDVDLSTLEQHRDSLFEAFLTIYSIKLLAELREGLYREYVRRSDDLGYVKGQIDFPRYANQWDRRHVVPCNYHERSADNLINRALKYAAHLGSMYSSSSDNFKRLKIAESILDMISLTPVSPQEIEGITFHRLNERFKPLVNMAYLLIAYMSFKFTYGGRKVFTFLIPMERVFEAFIANAIKKYVLPKCCSDVRIKIQSEIESKYILEGHKFRMQPDIMLEKGDERYIIDTKYKLLNPEDRRVGVSQSDVYQMLAYTLSYKSKKTMLLYPESLAGEIERDWNFAIDELRDNKIVVRTINLENLGEKFESEFVEELSKKIGSFLDINKE